MRDQRNSARFPHLAKAETLSHDSNIRRNDLARPSWCNNQIPLLFLYPASFSMHHQCFSAEKLSLSPSLKAP